MTRKCDRLSASPTGIKPHMKKREQFIVIREPVLWAAVKPRSCAEDQRV